MLVYISTQNCASSCSHMSFTGNLSCRRDLVKSLLYPGIVKTNIMREVPFSLSHVTFLVFRVLGLLQTPEDGINSILDAIFAPPHVSGVYFFGGKGRTLKSSALSCDTVLAEKLWTISCGLLFNLKLAHQATYLSS
ncbi:hypothetical protein LINPERPRIM_LOCUS35371 [Linum perenne]